MSAIGRDRECSQDAPVDRLFPCFASRIDTHHSVRWRRQLRILTWGTRAVFIIAAGLLMMGWYDEQYRGHARTKERSICLYPRSIDL